jgi:broad specificity phosphatase PhoE
MAPTVYLARHGERLDFVKPEWCETAENPHDAPLTERGEQQASELGTFLADRQIAHVFASPFSRVTCTAARVAAALPIPLPVKVESGCCEWLNAEWYSHAPGWPTVAELAKKYPSVSLAYEPVCSHDSNSKRFPETHADMVERASRTAGDLIRRYGSDGNLLFVGHGSSVEAFYQALVPAAKRRPIKVSYCSITVCVPQEDGSYSADIVADSSHLSSPESLRTTRYI